jgi:hypothetical protein
MKTSNIARSVIIILISLTIMHQFQLGQETRKTSSSTHDGYFFRAALGVGSNTIKESFRSSEGNFNMEISGISANGNFRIGYSFIKNLQFYGVLGANIMQNPTININGQEEKTSSTDVSLLSVGIGVNYYLPYNLFLSADLSSGINKITIDNKEAESDRGLIFNLEAGKEWKISSSWWLGGSLYFYTGSIDDKPFEGQQPSIKNTSYGINLIGIFN